MTGRFGRCSPCFVDVIIPYYSSSMTILWGRVWPAFVYAVLKASLGGVKELFEVAAYSNSGYNCTVLPDSLLDLPEAA